VTERDEDQNDAGLLIAGILTAEEQSFHDGQLIDL
jgi:hypothetical protein